MLADVNSQSKLDSRDKDVISVQGLSEIMERSSVDMSHRDLINEDDLLDNYNEIKELIKQNAITFEELLRQLGKTSI